MRQKAFTLAEILIVLMVIGIIAAMGIPALLKGIYQSQWRAGYKKAFNVVKNMYASERFGGSSLKSSDEKALMTVFDQMYNNMTQSGFVAPYSLDEIYNGGSAKQTTIYHSISYTFNGREVKGELSIPNLSDSSPWIISDDNIAYCVVRGSECNPVYKINASSSHEEALRNSCVAVIADVNGIQNSPNSIQEQTLTNGTKTPQLSSDRFFIYIGADGVTSGPRKFTLSGRLGADLN